MDDLKLLRDLGGDLEHEPPPTLVRQRDRFLRDRPRRNRSVWWTAGLVAAATATVVAVPAVLVSARDAIPIAGAEPVDMSGTRNVLVIGSDSRAGEDNAKYGPQESRMNMGQRSDTIMIVHVPADRSRATAVSVPRDSMVRIAACGSDPSRVAMINGAYNSGGAACLRTTLERLTGLRLHHTIEMDFAGFKGMVDALGGVQIKVREPINDQKSKLTLPAGTVTLDGEKALGYARLRYIGDGADVSRIKRQQALVTAMLKKARQQLAADPGKLKGFLGEVRKSVKTDLSLEAMYELGTQLLSTKLDTLSLPSQPYPEDKNRLQWKQPETDQLFKRLK